MEPPTFDYNRFRSAVSTVCIKRKASLKEARDIIERGTFTGSLNHPIEMTLDPILHSTLAITMNGAWETPSYYVTIHATFDVTQNAKFLGGYFVEYFPSIGKLVWTQYDNDHFSDFLNAVVAHGS